MQQRYGRDIKREDDASRLLPGHEVSLSNISVRVTRHTPF